MTTPPQPQPEPYAVLIEACRRLKMKPREITLMRDCLYSQLRFAIGSTLITPARIPAARRLIERGYLLQPADQPAPFDPVNFGLVVAAGANQFNKLIADANAVDGRA